MAAITLHSIATFFSDDQRLILRGENALKSNHVLSVSYDNECRRFSGKVQASMKDKTYEVEVFLGADGQVEDTKCNCPRGQLKCHHIAAVMIYANKNISSTSVSCKWSAAKKSSSSKEVKTIQDMYPKPKQFSVLGRHVTVDDISDFRSELNSKVGRHVGYSWLLMPEPEPQGKRVKTVEDVLTSKEFLETTNKNENLLQQLKVTSSDIDHVESVTKGQSESSLWYIYRKGRLTASNFGVVIKAMDSNRYPVSLFKRLLGEYDLSGMKAIQWGRDHEAVAVKAFTNSTGLVTRPSGLWLHQSGTLGASPDRLVCENVVLEVKCPFTHREETISYSIENDKNFILKKDPISGQIVVVKTHPYYHQIQGQLYLSMKDVCFLCIWTLKDMTVVKIDKDEMWGKQNIQRLIDFYVEKMVPKLIEGGC